MIKDTVNTILKNFQFFLVAWLVIIIGNQVFIFGACFKPYCIIAALPHTGVIAAFITYFWIKDQTNSSSEVDSRNASNDKERLYKKIDDWENELKAMELEELGVSKGGVLREETSSTINQQDVSVSKVYITKANEAKILSSSAFQPEDESFNDLYDKPLEFLLSRPELLLLQVYRKICEDPQKLLDAYNKIKRVDTKKYVWEGASPAYHFDICCPRLHAEFTNIEIPPEIKHKGDRAIERFRAYVKENKVLLESDEAKFIKGLEARFFLKNPPKSLRYANSGAQEIENFSLEQLKKAIDNLLITAQEFKNKDLNTANLINKLGYGTHKVKAARDPGNPLYTWHQYKLDLKNLLKQYYRVRFNHNLKFEKSLLEEIGFSACDYCKPS